MKHARWLWVVFLGVSGALAELDRGGIVELPVQPGVVQEAVGGRALEGSLKTPGQTGIDALAKGARTHHADVPAGLEAVDRDLALVAYQAGVFGGDGQNSLSVTNHVMPMLRLVYNPLGTMGASEADLQDHEQPALSFGANGFLNTLRKTTNRSLKRSYSTMPALRAGSAATSTSSRPARRSTSSPGVSTRSSSGTASPSTPKASWVRPRATPAA